MKLVSPIIALAALVLSATASYAAQPSPWEMWFQDPGSDMAARINWFGLYTMWFIVPVTLLVMLLLLIVMLRFNRRANPNPSRTSHNTLIEVIWTVAPIIILVAIAIPSFDLLDRQIAPEEEPDMTIKVTGYQWYWGYEYSDDSELSFDSIMLRDGEFADYGKEDKSVYPRLLAVDNELVVPVGKMVRVHVTAADVLHSFAIPSLGVRMDAVPGRLNETWFKVEREGIYYGQCSELCGRDHAFMPIAIRAVSQGRYDAWKAAAADDLEAANRALMAAVDSGENIKLAGN